MAFTAPKVMDREQESLAKSLDPGHWLVRGVAGSGKTIVLTCRAHHLRELHPDWRILVLCFNRVLAEHLARTIGADDRLEVLTFHAEGPGGSVRAAVRYPRTGRTRGRGGPAAALHRDDSCAR